ncbi:MAG: acyl-CoA dehydrogenase family protein [Ectothiorhodospiraceae bacterium AqS1]|nr:acyl-CoA dehydrogenase family protein [Ectothiorhodospiraceae bacterium AqS1]
MNSSFRFDFSSLPEESASLRERVRAFIRREREAGSLAGKAGAGINRHCPEFSRRCGEEGFIGMTWPAAYGGSERSFLERYVVTEELLAAGAPVWAHWVADRQSGPMLMRHARQSVCKSILPRIVRGECYFCIGMSEPDSGSDLYSARCRASPAPGGWQVSGRKIWTSNAHRSHYMIALLRTSPSTPDNRRHGLTQFLVAMDSPGIELRPIPNLTGEADFNELVFDDVFVPEEHLIGEVDGAWKQAASELAYERSGPERFLETIFVLYEFVRIAGERPKDRVAEGIGRLVAELFSLRAMSISVAGMLGQGRVPDVEAAVVKEQGTNWEQALPARVRDLAPLTGSGSPLRGGADGVAGGYRDADAAAAGFGVDPGARVDFEEILRHATLIAPKLTIQGGTREILRGIVARGLGLR